MKMKRKKPCAWRNFKYQPSKFVKEGKACLNNSISVCKKKGIVKKMWTTAWVSTANKKSPNFKSSNKPYHWSSKLLSTLMNFSKAKWSYGQIKQQLQKTSNPFCLSTHSSLKRVQLIFCFLIVMHQTQMESVLTFFAIKWESLLLSTVK